MDEVHGTLEAREPQKSVEEIHREQYLATEEQVINDYVMDVYTVTTTEMTYDQFNILFRDLLKILFVQNNIISKQIREDNARHL